ncbi:aquaporin family protein [Brevibacillus thermoruber]|jgi:glycerol uptake facilitator protein|uniref:Aquaporin family protein n=1 Tax=Brevibacillus thermoruber TaxID=33942 RepID=A0A9X3Z5T2_9BACL|nr:MIP/aquaporin family protein [Brevibacillus thermoruber]MDA5110990.1 aquaporin family protein [Brevibacillus thermoruber]
MEHPPALWRRSLAEFVGTALLVLIGPGSAAFHGILSAKANHPTTLADIGVISLAFAIIVTAMIYTFGNVSGCHINPAVTIGLAAAGRFSWRDVPAYVTAQCAGGIAGALLILVVLGTDGAVIGNLGATVLSPTTGYVQGIAIEALETFILMLVIMGVAVDSRAPHGFAGLVIGLTVGGIIMMTAGPTGSSFNPARTFGPYVVDSLAGGTVDWSHFPVYVIGPLLGAVLAAFTYEAISAPAPARVSATGRTTDTGR